MLCQYRGSRRCGCWCHGEAHLFVTFGNPAVITCHKVEPILESSQEAAATPNPGEGARVTGLPCEVDEKGADGEEEESGNNPAWGQRLDQQGAEACDHGQGSVGEVSRSSSELHTFGSRSVGRTIDEPDSR